jgi:hypothetical protein
MVNTARLASYLTGLTLVNNKIFQDGFNPEALRRVVPAQVEVHPGGALVEVPVAGRDPVGVQGAALAVHGRIRYNSNFLARKAFM